MKSGTVVMLGGGGHLVAFTHTTDGSGDFPASSSTTHYGSPIGGAPNVAVTLGHTGAGVYTVTPDKATFGAARLASWTAEVNEDAGDWTITGAINRTTGVLTLTIKDGGVATNVVSGSISFMLVFGPSGY